MAANPQTDHKFETDKNLEPPPKKSHTGFLIMVFLLLLALGGLHLLAAKMGWARTKPMAGRIGIPYAPSVAGALIGTIVLGCL